jgi:predicted dithiol-disulfide oxidoreductase (DUF899 family)
VQPGKRGDRTLLHFGAVDYQEVSDYEFQTPEGAIRLSQLFGDHDHLIVIHNMGSSCPACTMWADGYNGIHHHVVTRAAFVVSSPEPPEVQRKFAASRGWKFPMISHAGNTFAADMGFRTSEGPTAPAIGFRRSNTDMCPACIGAAVLYVAGSTSAGGIAALVLKTARAAGGTHERRGTSGTAGKRPSAAHSPRSDSARG